MKQSTPTWNWGGVHTRCLCFHLVGIVNAQLALARMSLSITDATPHPHTSTFSSMWHADPDTDMQTEQKLEGNVQSHSKQVYSAEKHQCYSQINVQIIRLTTLVSMDLTPDLFIIGVSRWVKISPFCIWSGKWCWKTASKCPGLALFADLPCCNFIGQSQWSPLPQTYISVPFPQPYWECSHLRGKRK